jgi:hypothetical protein
MKQNNSSISTKSLGKLLSKWPALVMPLALVKVKAAYSIRIEPPYRYLGCEVGELLEFKKDEP